MSLRDTIAAPATPPGKGGVGIIRVSGSYVRSLAEMLLQKIPKPRTAEFHVFKEKDGSVIDEGLVLFFPKPHSFTGEDVLEFQGHGGPVVVNRLLKRILEFNIRLAKPGEFSERAFLNNKIDLAQAEGIADLIDASSEQAARLAISSLQGDFSKKINDLLNELIELRIFVEAAIDFPEEEIDFLSDGKIEASLRKIIQEVEEIKKSAKQGAILRQGISLVISGPPNAGKSTLLNALCGRDISIVSNTPGTTRDIMREQILLDNIPLNIIDTAGLRSSEDAIEKEGIRRAWNEIEKADRILLIFDSKEPTVFETLSEFLSQFKLNIPITIIFNKMDISSLEKNPDKVYGHPVLYVSAKTGEGLDELKEHLKISIGYSSTNESLFLARERHIEALEKANEFLLQAQEQLIFKAGELLADDLRQAQHALSEITGKFTADDLLGKIFSSFCIGK